jgi:hypothetical protein
MVRTAIATLQTAWDCRWSRPGFQLEKTVGITRLEGTWVCTREGARQLIDPHDCETCPFWEKHEIATAPEARQSMHGVAASAIATRTAVDRLLYMAAWMLIGLSALLVFAVGLSILTTPLSVPLTLALWLAGAAIVGFGVSGGLPRPD